MIILIARASGRSKNIAMNYFSLVGVVPTKKNHIVTIMKLYTTWKQIKYLEMEPDFEL
jgi:hypothetical protein